MTKGKWLKLFSFFYAIIQKNINFLRRSSKKDDFIIENIFAVSYTHLDVYKRQNQKITSTDNFE